MDEPTLIAKALAFDAEAQEILFNRYYRRMMELSVKSQKNKVDAADVVMATFQSLFKTLHKFRYDGKGSFWKWLSGILYINTKEQQRTKFRWTIIEEDMAMMINMQRQIENKMDHKRLLQFVMRQSENVYVMVFILNVIMEWNHKEISERLGISESSSRTYLMRGQQYLYKQLSHTKHSFYDKQ